MTSYYEANREQLLAKQNQYYKDNIEARRAYQSAYTKKNPEKNREKQRRARFKARGGPPRTHKTDEERKEARSLYYLQRRASPEYKQYARKYQKKNYRKYYLANKSKYLANAVKRYARLRQRLPAWANVSAIGKFYEIAKQLTVATGIPHEVDHIIPLHGEKISGLHVENNLQVMPRPRMPHS